MFENNNKSSSEHEEQVKEEVECARNIKRRERKQSHETEEMIVAEIIRAIQKENNQNYNN